MKYRITPNLNDGKRNAPPIEADLLDLDELLTVIREELCNDEGMLFGVGFTLTVEHIG